MTTQPISAVGTKITFVTSVTFPNGFTYTSGSDNKPFFNPAYEKDTINFAITAGGLAHPYKDPAADYATIKVSTIPGTPEDKNFQIIARYHAARRGPNIEQITITITSPGAGGLTDVYTPAWFKKAETGRINIPDASGRLDSNSYIFFGEKSSST